MYDGCLQNDLYLKIIHYSIIHNLNVFQRDNYNNTHFTFISSQCSNTRDERTRSSTTKKGGIIFSKINIHYFFFFLRIRMLYSLLYALKIIEENNVQKVKMIIEQIRIVTLLESGQISLRR